MWDKYRACKMLSIPYKVYPLNEAVGGYANLVDRYIHISEDKKDDDRVFIHEISHILLHFQNVETAVGMDKTKNAIAEIEADTTAFVVCSVLGIADQKDYRKYITLFVKSLPKELQNADVINNSLKKIKEAAIIILNAGGWYAN